MKESKACGTACAGSKKTSCGCESENGVLECFSGNEIGMCEEAKSDVGNDSFFSDRSDITEMGDTKNISKNSSKNIKDISRNNRDSIRNIKDISGNIKDISRQINDNGNIKDISRQINDNGNIKVNIESYDNLQSSENNKNCSQSFCNENTANKNHSSSVCESINARDIKNRTKKEDLHKDHNYLHDTNLVNKNISISGRINSGSTDSENYKQESKEDKSKKTSFDNKDDKDLSFNSTEFRNKLEQLRINNVQNERTNVNIKQRTESKYCIDKNINKEELNTNFSNNMHEETQIRKEQNGGRDFNTSESINEEQIYFTNTDLSSKIQNVEDRLNEPLCTSTEEDYREAFSSYRKDSYLHKDDSYKDTYKDYHKTNYNSYRKDSYYKDYNKDTSLSRNENNYYNSSRGGEVSDLYRKAFIPDSYRRNIQNLYQNYTNPSPDPKTRKINTPLLSTLSHIFTSRATSAPPISIFADATEDSNIKDSNIKDSISYQSFYRRNSKTDIRLPVPSHFILGSDHLNQSLIERIDSEHPFSESSEYVGKISRSTTPIGNHPFLKDIRTSEKQAMRFTGDLYSKSTEINDITNIKEVNEIRNNSYIKDNDEIRNSNYTKDFNGQVQINESKFNSYSSVYNNLVEPLLVPHKNEFEDDIFSYVKRDSEKEDVKERISGGYNRRIPEKEFTENRHCKVINNVSARDINDIRSVKNRAYEVENKVDVNDAKYSKNRYYEIDNKAKYNEDYNNQRFEEVRRSNTSDIKYGSESRINNDRGNTYNLRNSFTSPQFSTTMDFKDNYLSSEGLNDSGSNIFGGEKDYRSISGCLAESDVSSSQAKCILLSMDQDGSRFIQKRLERSTEDEIRWFYMAVKGNIKDLCLDLFGNYVIQKLLESNVQDVNQAIMADCKKDIQELSLHMFGCRVIQKMLETPEGGSLIEHLKTNVVSLIEDQNGNHVIQKCVEKARDRSFVVKEFVKDPLRLSKHRYGCRVVQRLFENCKDSEISEIIAKISRNIPQLIEDQYGNYVLQHIIQNKASLRNTLINEILKLDNTLIFNYCCHKFASNVIEKCIPFSEAFVDIFLSKSSETGNPLIVGMACDRYANYVVQRVIEKKKNRVSATLKMYHAELKKSIYAKHILSKIQ